MKVTANTLRSILQTHVAEITFRRRLEKPGASPTRRMLCTNDVRFLKSKKAKLAFNYRVPTGTLPYDPASHGLVTVYDLLKQDFRQVPLETVNLIAAIRTTPDSNFWEYYNQVLSKMTPDTRNSLMDD